MPPSLRLPKVPMPLLATGVPGLDAVLGGGLPERSFNLLAGPPGSGKTTLAHQIMFALATPAQPALYFTMLGESPLKMLRYQQQFDFFDLDKLNHAIRFINLADDLSFGDLDKVMARIKSEVEVRAPRLVFIDSLRSASPTGPQGHADVRMQRFIQNLSVLMSSWQATTFLLDADFRETDANPVLDVADGLIRLSQNVQGNSVVRMMDIIKLRGQATLPGLHTFRMSGQGIQVFSPPALHAAQGAMSSTRAVSRLQMGVPELDKMMGGGLPAGHSLLVAGPSGSGKSTLAAAFLLEGHRSGETGVIAAFEQRTPHARGAALQALIEHDRVGVVDTQAATLSVDELATLILAEVQRRHATRVVIDSLSGFELALAPAFKSDFRVALARLVRALACAGVSVLMTSELEDRYTDFRFSPYGTAFLTDAIIVQRYVEIEGRLQRVMAVVKVRASAHADGLRLFHIDAHGIHIGKSLSGYQGLLTGHAEPRQSPGPSIDVALDG